MATGILINDFRPEYSENLLPEMIGTVERQYGANLVVSYDTNRVFEGDKSIKVTFITPFGDVDRAAFIINDYNTIIKKSGQYILSYRFYRDDNDVDDVDTYFFVKVFVNGILYSFNTFENDLRTVSGFDTSGWNTYCQSINVTEDDVILLQFEAYSNGNSTMLYFDGLKLEYDDRFLGTPSIYSKPLDNSINYRFYTGWGNYLDTQKTIGTPLNLVAGVDTPLRIRANTYNETQLPIDVDTFYLAGNLAVTAVTGTFVEGDTLTGGTSGATAYLKRINTVSNFGLHNYVGDFTGTETITGSISGATASFSSLSNGYITGRNGDSIDFMLYFKVVPSAINAELDIWIDIGGGVGELYRDTKYYRGTTEKGVIYTIPSGYTLDTWEANGGVIYLKSSVNMTVYLVSINVDRSHKAR